MADTRAMLERFARQLAQGEKLFDEGEPGDSMYVVQAGRVRLFRRVGPADVTIAMLGQGEVFGEMAVLEGLPAYSLGGGRRRLGGGGGHQVPVRADGAGQR